MFGVVVLLQGWPSVPVLNLCQPPGSHPGFFSFQLLQSSHQIWPASNFMLSKKHLRRFFRVICRVCFTDGLFHTGLTDSWFHHQSSFFHIFTESPTGFEGNRKRAFYGFLFNNGSSCCHSFAKSWFVESKTNIYSVDRSDVGVWSSSKAGPLSSFSD